MHQHIESDFFLKADRPLDLALAKGFVAIQRPLARLERGAGFAHFVRLRERTDGRRGQWRQGEAATLGLAAIEQRMPPAEHILIDCGHALPHRRIVQAFRSGAAFDGFAARRQLVGHGRRATVERLRQRRDLLQLLLGESHPALQFRVERGLVVQVDRAMQKRARRGDHDPLGPELGRRLLNLAKRRSRSPRHTLRPSTTPSESVKPEGAAFNAGANCSARGRDRDAPRPPAASARPPDCRRGR